MTMTIGTFVPWVVKMSWPFQIEKKPRFAFKRPFWAVSQVGPPVALHFAGFGVLVSESTVETASQYSNVTLFQSVVACLSLAPDH